MIRRTLLIIALSLVSTSSFAEVKPYFNVDLGLTDTDYDNGMYFEFGGGVQFNQNAELELSYNNFGDVGPFDTKVTSTAFNLNLGGPLSDTTRVYAILGSERLKADGNVSFGTFSVDIDASSTEGFYGIGVAVEQKENVSIRTKLVNHDSGDILTLSVGLAVYF